VVEDSAKVISFLASLLLLLRHTSVVWGHSTSRTTLPACRVTVIFASFTKIDSPFFLAIFRPITFAFFASKYHLVNVFF
jgi:hypothetical protein